MTYPIWDKIDERTLVYASRWEEAESLVKSTTFGVLVELSEGVIKNYRSDLFHDAKWIEENVTGPRQFDWVVRTSGTFLGDVIKHLKMEDWDGSVKYRMEIRNNDGHWVLVIYKAV